MFHVEHRPRFTWNIDPVSRGTSAPFHVEHRPRFTWNIGHSRDAAAIQACLQSGATMPARTTDPTRAAGPTLRRRPDSAPSTWTVRLLWLARCARGWRGVG